MMAEPQRQQTETATEPGVSEAMALAYKEILESSDNNPDRVIEELQTANASAPEDRQVSAENMATIEESIKAAGDDPQKFAQEMQNRNQLLMAELAAMLEEGRRQDDIEMRRQAEADADANQDQPISNAEAFVALMAAVFSKDFEPLKAVVQKIKDQEAKENPENPKKDGTTPDPEGEAPKTDPATPTPDPEGKVPEEAPAPEKTALESGGAVVVEKAADPTSEAMASQGDDLSTEREATLSEGFANNADKQVGDVDVSVVEAKTDPVTPANDTPEAKAENANPGFHDRDIIETIGRKFFGMDTSP